MSKENLQTMIMPNFWGVKEVYYGIVQVVDNSFSILILLRCLILLYMNNNHVNRTPTPGWETF